MYILSVLCIGWVLGIQVTCIVLVCLYVQVFIPSVNEHCDHFLVSDYLFDQAMIWFLTSSLLDHFKSVSYAFHAFLHTMIIVYCYISGVSCSYDSSASQLLKLGVSEFCSTILNSHVKSKVCFRVLSWNSQKGRL